MGLFDWIRGRRKATARQVVRLPISDIPDMLQAVQDKLQAVQEMRNLGTSIEETLKQYNKRRTAVLENISRIEYAFVTEIEAELGPKARRDCKKGIKSEGGYLIAAIESYKQRDYAAAIDYCNSSLSFNPGSASAFALRGLVLAHR